MMTPEAWRDAGQFFEWRGHRVFYRVEGTGDPLVLFHGFPTASWDWWRVWPTLVARYRVLALDMLGFGYSAKPFDFDYTVAHHADVYEALFAREGVARYRVLAHDLGVTIVQELLARRAPIDHVWLLNGGLFPETHRATIGQRLLASPLGPVLAPRMPFSAFARSMRAVWGETPLDEEELRAMWRMIKASDGKRVLPKLLSYMKQRRQNRMRWVYALVDAPMPVRLINGSVDPVSGAHVVRRYRQLAGPVDVIELPGVGHYPQVEAPDAVLAAIY